MDEKILQMLADVRAQLYCAPVEKLKLWAGKFAPLFDSAEASRAKTLNVLEDFLANVAKEEDGGKASLTDILKQLKLTIKVEENEEGKVETDKVKVKAEPESDGLPKDISGSKVLGTYSFRKEFKILGQIGDLKAGLSFTSYRRQVEDGQRKGYKDVEIIEGIIRAIQPQYKLRSYLEGRPGLELGEVNSIVRSYYKEQTATELYQQLSTLTQEPKESPQDFLFRALDLRQRVIFASKEKTKDSGMTYDTKLVQNMTLHALSTGLKDENIRHSFDAILTKEDVSDEKLISALNSITTREQERKSKFIKVNQLTVDPESRRGSEKAFSSDLKRLEAEVAMLKESIQSKQKNADDNSSSDKEGKVSWKCKWCEDGTTDRCDHCFKCGSNEHFARGCKQKKSQQQENSLGLH